MTHDEIMAMAREAGFRTGQLNLSNGPPVPFIAPASGTSCMFELERFAALVAEAEREACEALIRQLVAALEGYRRNHNDTQPCDAEREGRARLEGKPCA